MIETLLIENFQSHKRTELKFCKGLNIITGETDSGKTAIIRALQWLIWNEPSGDAFRSTWGGNTSVTAWEGKGEHDYVQRGVDEKGSFYYRPDVIQRAFGQTVPEEIRKHFNMTEINLQEQLDSPFLLSETPGKVAAFFNKVAGLDKIDSSMQYVQAQVRATNAVISYDSGFLQAKEKELTEYANLANAEMDLIVLENHDKRRTIHRQAKKALDSLVTDIEFIEIHIRDTEKVLKSEKKVNDLIKLIERKKELIESRKKLNDHFYKIKSTDKYLSICEQTIEPEQIVVNLVQKIAAVNDLQRGFTQFYNVVSKLQAVSKKQLKNAGELKQLEETWHEEFPEICPLCGTKIEKK